MKNFLVVYLCDNDFSYVLSIGLERLYDWSDHPEDYSEEQIKTYLIEYWISHMKLKHILPWKNLEMKPENMNTAINYLRQKIRVKFEDNKPELDHDSGSAYLNLKAKKAYLF